MPAAQKTCRAGTESTGRVPILDVAPWGVAKKLAKKTRKIAGPDCLAWNQTQKRSRVGMADLGRDAAGGVATVTIQSTPMDVVG